MQTIYPRQFHCSLPKVSPAALSDAAECCETHQTVVATARSHQEWARPLAPRYRLRTGLASLDLVVFPGCAASSLGHILSLVCLHAVLGILNRHRAVAYLAVKPVLHLVLGKRAIYTLMRLQPKIGGIIWVASYISGSSRPIWKRRAGRWYRSTTCGARPSSGSRKASKQ
jgi:hypothetical protein